jgi:TubC N-terminal docking domain
MTAAELLADLRRRGVALAPKGDRLSVDAPKGAVTDELRRSITDHKADLLALLEAGAATAELGRIEADLTAKNARLLELCAGDDRAAADRLQAQIRAIVGGEWLPAKRREARALDRLGRLPEADRFLLEDPDEGVGVDGYRRVPRGWAETEERSRHCVVHADRALAPGDRLYCPECRVGADGPAPRGWQCVCHSTARRYREQWGDWVCAREQCGMIAPSPRERP